MFIPLGVELDDLGAFVFAFISTESIGPGGDVIRHVLNDAGAAHSGLHYVWVLHRRSAWLPWQVVVSGWSEKREAREAITWVADSTLEIELVDSRVNGSMTKRWVTVR